MDKLAAVGATSGSLSAMVMGGAKGRVFSAQDVVNNDVMNSYREADAIESSMNNDKNYANPEQAKQQSFLNQVLNITFSGLPEGVTANANGKNVPVSSGGSMKKSFAGTN